MNKIRHVVWDWNGTLFDDSRALIESTIEAFDAAGLTPIDRESYQEFHSKSTPDFFDKLAGRKLGGDEYANILRLFRERYKGRCGNVQLAPDAEAALTLVRQTKRSQSLLSLHPHETLVSLVAERGISGFFSSLDGRREEGAPGKSVHLKRHLRSLNVLPSETLIIGDSVDDAVAAVDCRTCCILYHSGTYALHTFQSISACSFPVVANLMDAIRMALRWDDKP